MLNFLRCGIGYASEYNVFAVLCDAIYKRGIFERNEEINRKSFGRGVICKLLHELKRCSAYWYTADDGCMTASRKSEYQHKNDGDKSDFMGGGSNMLIISKFRCVGFFS
jgi:hypothetical protein